MTCARVEKSQAVYLQLLAQESAGIQQVEA